MLITHESAKYAVIFISNKNVPLEDEYYHTQKILNQRVTQIDGYVFKENVIDENGRSVTISYWEHLEALKNWFDDKVHKKAQMKAYKKWYSSFKTVVCKIEKQKVWNFDK